MFRYRTLIVLLSRVCKKTSVVNSHDKILLLKDSGLYKTCIQSKNGDRYWSREFYCFEKAREDFVNRVEARKLIEAINN